MSHLNQGLANTRKDTLNALIQPTCVSHSLFRPPFLFGFLAGWRPSKLGDLSSPPTLNDTLKQRSPSTSIVRDSIPCILLGMAVCIGRGWKINFYSVTG